MDNPEPRGAEALIIAGTPIASRLFIGTAGYPNQQAMLAAIEASGAEIVTMSIRRASMEGYAESLIDLLGGHFRVLPNTSGCVTVKDAVLTAQLAREALEAVREPVLLSTTKPPVVRWAEGAGFRLAAQNGVLAGFTAFVLVRPEPARPGRAVQPDARPGRAT